MAADKKTPGGVLGTAGMVAAVGVFDRGEVYAAHAA